MPRDVGVVDHDIVAGITPQGEPVLEKIEDKLITVVEVEGQIRHIRISRKARSANRENKFGQSLNQS